MSIEKSNTAVEVNSSNHSFNTPNHEVVDEEEHLELKHHTREEIAASGKWYDQSYFGGRIPSYSNAMVQIFMMSFVLFMTPGMFNAISGIGSAGISDVSVADNANVALYSTFATIGVIGGVICNIIGSKWCLTIGGTGYFMYTASLLCFHYTENAGFCIFAGAFLGVCASLTWAAQGQIIMSYTTEDRKGHAIMIFWIIFNMGAVIGSLIPLGQNLRSNESKVNAGTFAAFLVLIGIGIFLATFMLPIDKVYKSDGTKVTKKNYPSISDEIKGWLHVLKNEPKIYLLFPMFAASNWFTTYQFNDFNAAKFTIRTRSLNSLLYWLFQMIGALFIGNILDWTYFRRSVRARIGWVLVFILGMAIWGGGLKFQQGYTRESVVDMTPIDFKDSGYGGPVVLYMCYGFYDAIFQNFIFWVLGALSNNPKKVALYASFYKGIQSAFAAIVWRLDAMEKSYMSLFASSWGFVQGSLVIAAPLILLWITDHTDIKEDGIVDIVDQGELEVVNSTTQAPEIKDEKIV